MTRKKATRRETSTHSNLRQILARQGINEMCDSVCKRWRKLFVLIPKHQSKTRGKCLPDCSCEPRYVPLRSHDLVLHSAFGSLLPDPGRRVKFQIVLRYSYILGVLKYSSAADSDTPHE